jgi:hypothetical protein
MVISHSYTFRLSGNASLFVDQGPQLSLDCGLEHAR